MVLVSALVTQGSMPSIACFMQGDYMSGSHLEALKDHLTSYYKAVRPDAVALVDAFDFTDRHLSSILGRYDGQVYGNLYEWAKASPLNKTQVGVVVG